MFAPGPATIPEEGQAGDARLDARIRADQLATLCRSVTVALPVNALLGVASLFVAGRSGQGGAALLWLAASTFVNGARFLLCRAASASVQDASAARPDTDRWLRLSWRWALASGLVWAAVPALCEGYRGPDTLFFLTVTCGITAGAVTHGMAYARVPIAFITPPLLSAAGLLLLSGSLDRFCLAATVLLYLAALIRSARQTEVGFREASRLKHEATDLARSLGLAHARSVDIADELRHRAAHDPLTGLLNRSGFVSAAEAPDGARDARWLLLLDLDGFKAVNDAFGHETGDRVLAEVAGRLRAVLPAGAVAARLGGDEFAVLYRPADTDPTPPELAGRLIRAVAAPFESGPGRLGVSIGVCRWQDGRIDATLIGADEALYAAKSAGRNRFREFDDVLRRRCAVRLDVERDLAAALAARELEMWFQPIFREGGGRVASFEALLRWNHPRHGPLPPPDVVAIAAVAGLSEALLGFVLDEACATASRIRALRGECIPVSVNVSPRELAQLDVVALATRSLKQHRLPAGLLGMELTEEAAVDFGVVQAKLAGLREAGVTLAIDDFGVGYASLASIRHLRADQVKIDRSFVTGLSGSPEDRTLVEAVLSLGRAMRFDVVAEGVETAIDLQVLRELGCPLMQGYHLGRPMRADAVVAWLEGGRAEAA